MSHPAWGARIEVLLLVSYVMLGGTSHPAWGAWIEVN